jgi:hypothetical protein
VPGPRGAVVCGVRGEVQARNFYLAYTRYIII